MKHSYECSVYKISSQLRQLRLLMTLTHKVVSHHDSEWPVHD